MKILGIDPGTATTGYGLIYVTGPASYQLLDYGLVSTSKDLPYGQRLLSIHDHISDILNAHHPDEVAIERLFFATNARTAISVGQATGVIRLAIQRFNLPVFDYTPMQVKLSVSGSGKADKALMKKSIWKMFRVRAKKGQRTHFDNAADAIAIAVCHALKLQNSPRPL